MAQSNSDPLDPRELQARMDALTQANLRLLRRVSHLEERVASLDGAAPSVALRAIAEEPPRTVFEPAPQEPAVPEPVEAQLGQTPPPEMPGATASEAAAPAAPSEPDELFPAPASAPAPAHHESVETSVGLTWLNRIGAVTLILGAAFFFKYAVDNDWIGPTARVLIGVLAGLGLLVGGERLRSRGHDRYAQGISAAGVCVLYLTFWAAASLYKLIPAWFAFVAMVADTALAGALAIRHKAVPLAVLGLLGGYLTPVALSTGEYHPWIFFGFLALLNAGWLWVARSQGWRVLDLIALPVTLLLGAAVGEDLRAEDQGLVGTFAALTQYAVFILSPVPLFPLIAQLAAGIAVGAAWAGDPAGFAGPALPLIATGLCCAHMRRMEQLPLMTLAGFVAGYILMRERAGAEHTAILLTIATGAFLLFHVWLPVRLVSRLPVSRQDLALQPANAVFLFAAGMDLLGGQYRDWSGLFTAAMGAVYLATGFVVWPRLREASKDGKPVVLLAGVAIALFTAAIPVQFESIRITVLWAVEAVALAWIARRFEGWQGRAACLAVGALALLRLLLVDLTGYMGPVAEEALLANPRFATVIVVVLSLGGAAWILSPEKWALPPYLGAHLAMLAGLGVEISRHAARTAGADARSYAMVGISLMMAAYGLGLVGVGVATRTRLNRVLGLGLLGLVIVKLYLADVWMMRRIYRIVAFAGLGGLLLATSFLYSRFRTKIEALLSDEPA